MSITVTNPWLNLLFINLGLLGVFLIWLFAGEWWGKRGGGKALARSTMLVVGLITLAFINLIVVSFELGSVQ